MILHLQYQSSIASDTVAFQNILANEQKCVYYLLRQRKYGLFKSRPVFQSSTATSKSERERERFSGKLYKITQYHNKSVTRPLKKRWQAVINDHSTQHHHRTIIKVIILTTYCYIYLGKKVYRIRFFFYCFCLSHCIKPYNYIHNSAATLGIVLCFASLLRCRILLIQYISSLDSSISLE